MKKSNQKIPGFIIMLAFLAGIILPQASCKKFIEVDLPINSNTAGQVYGENSTAVSVMTGIYAVFLQYEANIVGTQGMSLPFSLMSDELTPTIETENPYYKNTLNGTHLYGLWDGGYRIIIYRVNALLEGLAKADKISADVRARLIAEAKFVRAFTYFNLVNLYGDVPLVLTTDFMKNANIERSPVDKIYEQIVKDLLEAEPVLTEEFLAGDLLTSTEERVRPNRSAVQALLARVYLYRRNWQKAEEYAAKVISSPSFQLVALNDVFLKNSHEAIWQLQPNPTNDQGTNNPDAWSFINRGNTPGTKPLFGLSQSLLDGFEPDDERKNAWVSIITAQSVDYSIPFKYKMGRGNATQPQTEYVMVFRLAEQYLIRAEARAEQGNLEGAKEDIGKIRARAGLGGISSGIKDDIVNAIIHERRVELFTEFGHRWFDLKRWGIIDQVMPAVALEKGASWAPYKALLPIPYKEFDRNPALRGHQNPGYTETP